MVIVFVLINCGMGHETDTITSLKKLCDIVHGTFGIYDFICKFNYDDVKSFEESVQKIRKIKHVTHTITIHAIPEQS